ncbi:MAG: DNRLRE domain-containing protein [Bacteroidetes bacterium]|nr:DNRLRE domain-containing protein [Bacteroidota bacterium]MBL7104654.1 DNRLRE domain-containing protein [Bacteroidales bacterium]
MKTSKNKSFTLIAILIAINFQILSQVIIEIQPGPAEGKDARVWSLDPHDNFGDHLYMKANAWTWGGTFGIERSFIEFDLSVIPPDTEILEAELSLFYHFLGGNPEQTHSGDNYTLLQRIISPWDEYTVNWNSQPSITSQNQVIIPPSTGPQQDYTNIDVTDLINDMLNDPDNSHGFLFRIMTEETYRRVALASSDHPEPSRWPKLIITLDCDEPVADFVYSVNNNFVEFTDSSLYASSWTWDFGDGYYSTLQNPIHYYSEPGEYEVCLIAENDCGSDTICKTVRVALTFIQDRQANNSIKIIPNPVINRAIISLPGNNHTYAQITIFNCFSKVVKNDKIFFNNSNSSFELDFSLYASGVYLLKIITEDYSLTEKFIIK